MSFFNFAPIEAIKLSKNPEDFFKQKQQKYGDIFPLFFT